MPNARKLPEGFLEEAEKQMGNDLPLCPICKDGQKCDDVISHSKEWNTK